MRLRIVQTQAQTFEVTCWAIGPELHQIGATIPNFADDSRAFIFDPGRGSRQPMLKPRNVRFPVANLKVEIVLAVLSCGNWGRSFFGAFR